MNGILNILKPTGMTSHDVVSKVRKILGIKKVGHAGTLDPNVAGVLPICVGKYTKFSDILINGDKEYIVELILGTMTDTQDAYGEITKKSDDIVINHDTIKDIVANFAGIQLQTPPAYSAAKLNGKKLYEYARQNIIVEKKAKSIDIKTIDILHIKNERVLMKVVCSKGTYMRTLCNDIGEKLGTYGHMGVLIRTNAKGLLIENSITLDELKFMYDNDELDKCMISPDDIVPMEKVSVEDTYYDKLIVGNEINFDTSTIYNENFYLYCKNILIGIGIKVGNNHIKVKKMLIDTE